MEKKISFSANNISAQIYVDGWKTVGAIQINANKRLALFQREVSKSSTSDLTVTTFNTEYKPYVPVIGMAHSANNIRYLIGSDATIKLIGATGTSNINCIWKY